MITLYIPRPPSTNNLYRNAGRRRVKTKNYETWIDHAALMIRRLSTARNACITGPVAVSITIPKPDNRRRDLDNMAKPILDLLVSQGVINDDRQVDELHMVWEPGISGAVNCCVEVRRLETAEDRIRRAVAASREVA